MLVSVNLISLKHFLTLARFFLLLFLLPLLAEWRCANATFYFVLLKGNNFEVKKSL